MVPFAVSLFSHHRPVNERQAAFRFALGKLQRVDVFQTGFVLVHLLADNHFYTSVKQEGKKKKRKNTFQIIFH